MQISRQSRPDSRGKGDIYHTATAAVVGGILFSGVLALGILMATHGGRGLRAVAPGQDRRAYQLLIAGGIVTALASSVLCSSSVCTGFLADLAS
jgi:hypothetical protein